MAVAVHGAKRQPSTHMGRKEKEAGVRSILVFGLEK